MSRPHLIPAVHPTERLVGEAPAIAALRAQIRHLAAFDSPPDVQQAEAYYEEALMLAKELSMRPLQAHCHLGLGTLYAKIGRREQAHADLSTAIDLYRALGMTLWLPQAEAALAQVE